MNTASHSSVPLHVLRETTSGTEHVRKAARFLGHPKLCFDPAFKATRHALNTRHSSDHSRPEGNLPTWNEAVEDDDEKLTIGEMIWHVIIVTAFMSACWALHRIVSEIS